jgi:MFS transporter, putative metabolite:H+ symporter
MPESSPSLPPGANAETKRAISATLFVAALGYLVDIYDLTLFSIVRVKSLKEIGVPEASLLDEGILLINWQMFGLLLGGILWGVLGDKRGRLSVLFGSIVLYSVANIANAYVSSVSTYAVLRFLAGIGLAGELGAGITLVSESMPKHSRGIGTSIVAGIGLSGAVAAYAAMFQKLASKSSERGNFFRLFSQRERAIKYFSIIMVGVPIWFVVGILITFSPELGKALGMTELPVAGRAIMFCYAGLTVSDVASGLLSYVLKSRKKAIYVFLALTGAAIAAYFLVSPLPVSSFYWVCLALGLGCGYWAMFVTVASEQFGTNIRATATTTVPNFVRGTVPLLTFAFQGLKPGFGVVGSAEIIGAACIALAFLATTRLEETYGKDLDYIE